MAGSLGRKTGLHRRKVYRHLDEFTQLGAPLRESEVTMTLRDVAVAEPIRDPWGKSTR